jgi:hypothetical protein
MDRQLQMVHQVDLLYRRRLQQETCMNRQSSKYERFARQKGLGIKKIAFIFTFGFHGL